MTPAEAAAARDDDAQRKRNSSAQARGALVGLELVPMPDGSWICARWGSSEAPRVLANVDEAEAFLVEKERDA